MLYLHIDLGLKVTVKEDKFKDKSKGKVFNFLYNMIIVNLYWVNHILMLLFNFKYEISFEKVSHLLRFHQKHTLLE